MNYILIRKYQAYIGRWYAVFYFPDIGMRNEIALDSEDADIDEAASRLYECLKPKENPIW